GQGVPVLAGKSDVHDDQVGCLISNRPGRLRGVKRGFRRVPGGTEHGGSQLLAHGIVLDDQDAIRLLEELRERGGRVALRPGRVFGRRTAIVDPLPSSLATWIDPPRRWTSFFVSARPSPEPW